MKFTSYEARKSLELVWCCMLSSGILLRLHPAMRSETAYWHYPFTCYWHCPFYSFRLAPDPLRLKGGLFGELADLIVGETSV